MKLRPAELLTLMLLFLFSCNTSVIDANKVMNDFTTEGFIDEHHYQIIIKGVPNSKSAGLVERREDACNAAKSKINETVIQRISDYYIINEIQKNKLKDKKEILNLPEVETELREDICKLLKYGYKAFEYYNDDCSCVIVYRLYKNNLMDYIDSMHIKLILKKDKIAKEITKK